MADKKTYSEKLRDPRWQKKRLEILYRDDWCCQRCFDPESTLIVHHRRYLPNREPWDYPDGLLVTLCESCHDYEREARGEFEQDLLEILKEKFFADDLETLCKGFMNMETGYLEDVTAAVIEWTLTGKLRKLGDEYFETVKKKNEEKADAQNPDSQA